MERTKEEFLKLYEPLHDAFARFCHAKAYGVIEAEDLISESILQALKSFNTLKNDAAFLSFLFSIASRIVHKKNRRLKYKADYDENVLSQIPESGIDAETRLDVELLYKVLNTLPRNQKEALILFEISGFSIKEVAQIQNASVSAVKQRLKRGRERLSVIFQSDLLKSESLTKQSSLLMTVFF